MNNIGEKYLPIGTVVMLKGGSKRVMITGFCSMATEDQSKMFDYAGCMFPEGFLSSDQTALFNHDQIERIYHMGLIDEEEQKFKTTLKTLVSQMNGVNAPSNETLTTMDQSIPPIGPGLPGYSQQPVSGEYSSDTSNTNSMTQQSTVQTNAGANIRFDENGTIVSE